MEDSDILKRFDNDKLIDVVKNYKRYGYDDEIRDYAIRLLEERGWSVDDLKTFGYWENSDYEEALIQYKAYCRNSLIAVCVLVLSVIVKTCSDSLFSIGQKNCQLFVAKLRNFLDSHNRMVLY